MNPDYLSGKRVLVTGGTGFVGRHLLPVLQEAGVHITCLVRASSRRDQLPAGIAIAQADLSTGQGLAEAVREQDIVMHMAALLFGLRWQDYLRANALAARHLGEALRQSDVQRVVLVSSLAATGPSALSPGVHDDTPPAPVSAYGWSKFMAEQTLGRALGDRLVTLRPPIIYGSGDRGLLPCFQGAARGLAVTPGWKREFPVSVIHASDVAQALLLLCAPEAHGVYHVNDGHEYTMRTFNQAMGAALHREVHTIPVPLPVMAVASAGSSLFGLFHARLHPGARPPSLTLDKYREARQAGWLCDASRIRQELGFLPRMTLADGMVEAVEGYCKEGLLTLPDTGFMAGYHKRKRDIL